MKIDIRPYNENKQAHGYWETYWYNEQLWHKAFYEYDNEIGYEENYHILGMEKAILNISYHI